MSGQNQPNEEDKIIVLDSTSDGVTTIETLKKEEPVKEDVVEDDVTEGEEDGSVGDDGDGEDDSSLAAAEDDLGPQNDDDGSGDDGEDADVEEDVDDEDEGLSLEELTGQEEPAPKRKVKRSVQDRINEATKFKREAERERDAALQELAALRKQVADGEKPLTDATDDGNDKTSTSKDDASDGLPDPAAYKYGEVDPQYIRDLASHAADEAARKLEQKFETQRQEEAAQRKAEELQTKYETKLTEGLEYADDFDKVVVTRADKGEYPLSENVTMMALDSEVGHKVLYDIAKNLKLAKQIDAMDATGQARAFGRLEARHLGEASPAPKRKVSKAPAPPNRRSRGTSTKSGLDPQTASIADLEKAYAEGEIG